ncbi:MAG: hypothetical protein QW035_04145 [Candidatus Anstonellales archaeon]
MKLTRINGITYLSLEEFEGKDIEVLKVREDIVLLIAKPKEGKSAEDALLKKLVGIRLENRKKEAIDRQLSKEEAETLRSLIKKGSVKTYRTKSGETIYTVNKAIVDKILRRGTKDPEPNASYSELKRKGFIILEDEKEAEALSKLISEAGEQNLFKGIRGFDLKFYIMSTMLYQKEKELILKALKEEMTHIEIATAIREDPELVRCALQLMREEGVVQEPREGIFSEV